jgi:hypothetical protein
MTANQFEALVASHLPPEQSLDEELVRLAKLSAKQRAEVAERLVLVDAYLTGERQGNAEADEAAAKMGRSRRQFLRLVAKVREHGPVRGLAPGYRNNPRQSQPRDGLFKGASGDQGFDEVDEIVRDWVRLGEGDPIGILATKVRAQCAAFDLVPPSDATLRKRIHALRAEGYERAGSSSFGADLLVDQVTLDLPLGDAQDSSLGTATFIVDTYTTMIVGIGLSIGGPGIEGVSLALLDAMEARQPSLQWCNSVIADKIGRLTWMLPPGMEAPSALDEMAAAQSIEFRMLPSGTRRSGAALMRLLGDRLGPYPFAPRAERDEKVKAGRPGVSLDVARRVVATAADSWNRSRHSVDESIPKVRAFRGRKMKVLTSQLIAVFEPVLTPGELVAPQNPECQPEHSKADPQHRL